MARESRIIEFRDRFEAIDFLRPFLHDHFQMGQLRRMLQEERRGIGVTAMTDYAVIEQVADLLVHRHVRIMERFDLFEPGFHEVTEPAEAASEPAEAPVEPDDELPEESPPPQDLTPLAQNQAAALVQAAESGAPFCEA